MDESPTQADARHAAELAARASYGRLVAILASRTRDIAATEDALSEAFSAALATWPERGVPDKPEAWLLTAARRNLMHRERHRQVQNLAVEELVRRFDERTQATDWLEVDDRLKLLFVCAHPAIDENIRTPLMLQAVLGLDAQRVASAFLIAPTTMGQRLVRAKTKIKEAALGFRVPGPGELADRLDDVMRAVYVAFGVAWDDLQDGVGLADEAIYLGRLLVSLLPDEPEPKGLLALMLFCHARRDARRDGAGRFVPLAEQDPRRWSAGMVVEAEALLIDAARAARFGRFQCEAAIQSVHAQRAVTGVLQHDALCTLYELLLERCPSIGVAVARVGALLEAGRTDDAQVALNALSEGDVRAYQPYWVVRARMAERQGEKDSLRTCVARALGLTEDPAVRRFLGDWLGT